MLNIIPFDIQEIQIRKAHYTILRDKNATYLDALDNDPILEKSWGIVHQWVLENIPTAYELSQTTKEFRAVKGRIWGHKTYHKVSRPILNLDQLIFSIISIIHAQQKQSVEKIIYNATKTILNDVIHCCSKFLDKTYVDHVPEPQLESQYESAQFIVWHSLSTFKDLVIYKKKTDKFFAKKKHEMNDYQRLIHSVNEKLLDQFLPLCQAFDELKSLVIENTEYKHPKPLDMKNIRTCGWCFRPIRFSPKSDTLIAYHGFQRAENYGQGMMTHSSCHGSMEKCLEISPDITLQKLDFFKKQFESFNPETLTQKIQKHAEICDQYNTAVKTATIGYDQIRELRKQRSIHYSTVRDSICFYAEALNIFQVIEEMLTKHHPNLAQATFPIYSEDEINNVLNQANELKKQLDQLL